MEACEGAEVYLRSFITSALVWGNYPLGRSFQYVLHRKLREAPERVWTFWRRAKYLSAVWNWTMIRPLFSLQSIHYALPLFSLQSSHYTRPLFSLQSSHYTRPLFSLQSNHYTPPLFSLQSSHYTPPLFSLQSSHYTLPLLSLQSSHYTRPLFSLQSSHYTFWAIPSRRWNIKVRVT